MNKTKEDIQNAIQIFENKNGIKIENYYWQQKSDKRFTIKDKYIGEDIFEQNICEWLEICEDEIDRRYLLELLQSYLYFTQDRFQDDIQKIVEQLVQEGVCIKDTLFVTFPSKSGNASGGDNISASLTMAIMYEGKKQNIITDVEKASEQLLEQLDSCSTIVFVDDIIGSGKTLHANVSKFMERFTFKEDIIFYIATLCGRERKIMEKVKQFHKKYQREFKSIVLYPLKKHFDEELMLDKDKRLRVERLEKLVGENALEDLDKSFFMGFEGNQLLVSFYYNTPNNTLSIFWRPSEVSVPLFLRTSYKRISISECRASKEKLKKNAYEWGRMQK